MKCPHCQTELYVNNAFRCSVCRRELSAPQYPGSVWNPVRAGRIVVNELLRSPEGWAGIIVVAMAAMIWWLWTG